MPSLSSQADFEVIFRRLVPKAAAKDYESCGLETIVVIGYYCLDQEGNPKGRKCNIPWNYQPRVIQFNRGLVEECLLPSNITQPLFDHTPLKI